MNTIQPLRLAIGSHRAGSGKGCAMNVISWESGDTTITDMPACADEMLALVVQQVNDTVCTHRDGDLLCPTCSVAVLDLAHRIVGTGTHPLTVLERRQVWVRVAAAEARSAHAPSTEGRLERAHRTIDRWYEYAGFTPDTIPAEVTEQAVARMLAVAP